MQRTRRTTNVAVEPTEHAWYADVSNAIEHAGATVVPLAEAEALVWLDNQNFDIGSRLHPRLRWVQFTPAGVDAWIGEDWVDASRTFTAARGVYNDAVAEHALALLLAVARRLHICARSGTWDRAQKEGRTLHDATVAVVGAGGIGEGVIHRLAAFGTDVIAVTRSGRNVKGASICLSFSQLGDVWSSADYFVLAAPSTAETRHLVGAEELISMRKNAWIINIARGDLIDTEALVRALSSGAIAGAALDTTDPEPLPDGHPLWSMNDVLITPHIANPAGAHKARFEEFVGRNAARFVSGEPLLGVVDLERAY